MPQTLRPSRGRSLRSLAAAAALALGTAGCLSDPAAPPQGARVAIHAGIRGNLQTTVATRVHVRISYYTGGEQSVDLVDRYLPVSPSGTTETMAVDILPCLGVGRQIPSDALSPHAPAPPPALVAAAGTVARQASDTGSSVPGCYVNVNVALEEGEQVLDSYYTYATLYVGRVTEIEPIALFAGTNPPTITIAPNSAISVDPNLVRIPITAKDPDGNLSNFYTFVEDSLGGYFSSFYVYLDQPRDSVGGYLYGFVPQPSWQDTYQSHAQVTVYDTKGQYATSDFVRLLTPDQLAPSATSVSYDISGASATVTFDASDPNDDLQYVEVLFRDATASTVFSPLLAPVCRIGVAATGGAGLKVTCPAPTLESGTNPANVEAIVIPVDAAGNAGYAGRSTPPTLRH